MKARKLNKRGITRPLYKFYNTWLNYNVWFVKKNNIWHYYTDKDKNLHISGLTEDTITTRQDIVKIEY